MASEAVAAKAAEERGKQADAKVVDFESIAQKNAAAHKTVRSGAACDLDAQERRREGVERAGRLREELGEGPVTGIEGRLAYRFAKRAFDVAFSAAVLVAFCWLFAIIAALIKADDPKGPVLFKQRRVGKGGETFQMYKFRSMCVDAEERLAELRELNEKTGPVFKMAEDPRVTRVGRWLRKLSLDELPQFINVLAGDMSVVGPRPALPNEVATYNDYQRQRLLVKPGMTCYWQTRRNRDSITFDEWVDMDLRRYPPTSARWPTPAPWTAACSIAATCSGGRRSSPYATWATARCAPPASPCPCKVRVSPASTWARSPSSSTTTGDTCCLSPRPTWARVATPSWPRWSPSIWNAPWRP